MKKLSLLFALLLVLPLFNSCEEETKNLLLGKWSWVSGTDACYDGSVLVETNTISEPFFLYVEFLKGGTGYIYEDATTSQAFTWKKDGSTLTINEGTVDEMVETIVTLNKATLVVELTQTGECDSNDLTITMVKLP